jgi:ParB family chromosome partitioning protein
MQRQDLTILEQADGFQMMIDLGDSIKDIAKDTGFSQTTIKHRVKLLDLDRSKLDKAVKERPIKMEDLIKLEAVKDPKKKDELVAELGTNNFNWKLHDILEGQKWEKDKVKILAAIEGFAKKIPSSVSYWQLDRKKCIEAKDIKDGIVVGFTPEESREYFYRELPYSNCIELYLKPKGFDKQQEQAKKEAAKAKAKEKSDKELAKINKEIEKQIDAAEAKVAALHMEFLAEFFKGGFFKAQPKDLKPVIQTFLKTIDGYEFGFGIQGRAKFMKDFLGIDFEEDCEEDAILEHLEDKAFDILLFYMITQIMDSTDSPYLCQHYGDYSIRYNLKDNIVDLRDMLEALGYEASDEENKFYDGGLLNEQPGDEEVSDSE